MAFNIKGLGFLRFGFRFGVLRLGRCGVGGWIDADLMDLGLLNGVW